MLMVVWKRKEERPEGEGGCNMGSSARET